MFFVSSVKSSQLQDRSEHISHCDHVISRWLFFYIYFLSRNTKEYQSLVARYSCCKDSDWYFCIGHHMKKDYWLHCDSIWLGISNFVLRLTNVRDIQCSFILRSSFSAPNANIHIFITHLQWLKVHQPHLWTVAKKIPLCKLSFSTLDDKYLSQNFNISKFLSYVQVQLMQRCMLDYC